MVKVPIVKLYYPSGAEVLLGGQNICFGSTVAFEYKYKENNVDSGKLTLKFNQPIPFSLLLFEPGTIYHVKWGFIGNLSNTRKVAINSLSTSVNSTGYSLILDLIPSAAYKDAGNNWKDLESAINDGLLYKIKWWDYEGTEVIVEVSSKNGELVATSKMAQTLYKLEELNKPAITTPVSELLQQSIQANVDPMITSGITSLPNIIQESTDLSKTDMYQSIKKLIEDYIARRLAGYGLDVMDDTYKIQPVDPSSTAWFTLNAASGGGKVNIISAVVSKGSTTAQGTGTVASTVDIAEGTVNTEVTELSDQDLPALAVARDIQGAVTDTLGVVFKDNKVVKIKLHGTNFIEDLDPEVQRKYALRFSAPRHQAEKAKRKEQSLVEKLDRANTPEPVSVLPPPFLGSDRPTRIARQQIMTDFDAYLNTTKSQQDIKLEARPIPRNILERVTQTTSTPDLLSEARNRALSLELNSFFNNLQAAVVIEGAPFLEVGFNFNLVGLGEPARGKFHATEVTHKITAGKYTTAITAGKVPNGYTRRVLRHIQALEEYAGQFDEDEIIAVGSNELVEIFSDEDFKAIIDGNRAIIDKAKEDDDYNAVIDADFSSETELGSSITRGTVNVNPDIQVK